MSNALRSNRFEVALLSLEEEYGRDLHIVVMDLLADAMHWCDQSGEDFHWLLIQACRHYFNERNDQPDDRRML